MLYWISILVAVALFYFLYKQNLSRSAQLLNKFPGGWFIPGVGNCYIMLGNPNAMKDKISNYLRVNGRVCRFWMFTTPMVFVADNEVAQQILSLPNNVEKGDSYKALKHYFGDGLIFSEAEKWRRDRKQLNAGLKMTMFQGFLDIFNQWAHKLREELEVGGYSNGNETQLDNVVAKCTLNILYEAVLGRVSKSESGGGGSDSDILKCMGLVKECIKLRMFTPWVALPIIKQFSRLGRAEAEMKGVLQTEVFQYIEKRIAVLRESVGNIDSVNGTPKCIMDILLDPSIPRPFQEICDQVLTFLTAGSDTTTLATNYTLFLLAHNPRHQEKVVQELQQIYGQELNVNKVTFDHLRKMEYMEMCIKETLRIFPPGPLFARKIQTDVHLTGKCEGLIIPKGSEVAFFIYDLHRDPSVFPEPDKFDPARFSKSATLGRPQYAFLPFSAGIRNCIGQKYAMLKLKVLLTYILTTYQVTTTMSIPEVKPTYSLALDPSVPIRLKLILRHTTTGN